MERMPVAEHTNEDSKEDYLTGDENSYEGNSGDNHEKLNVETAILEEKCADESASEGSLDSMVTDDSVAKANNIEKKGLLSKLLNMRKEVAPEIRELRKRKRKKILKIVGIAFGIIAALFIALVVFAMITADKIDNDIEDMKDAEINGLSYKYPGLWVAEEQQTDSLDNGNVLYDEYNRWNKDDNTFMARMRMYYLGDDGAIDFTDYYGSSFFKDELDSKTIDINGTEISIKEYDTEIGVTDSDETIDTRTYTAEFEKDYSDFFVLIDAKSDVYNSAVFEEIIKEIGVKTYKNPRSVKGISAKYTGDKTPGTTIDSGDGKVTVTVEYDDGNKFTAHEWSMDKSITLEEGKKETATISCHGQTCELEVAGRKPEKISAKYSGSTKAGETISTEDITVNVEFDTGEKEEVEDFKIENGVTLKAGETSVVKITYGGLTYDLKVECTTLSESQYKDKCKSRNYKNQLREESFDEHIKIYGQVLQDCGDGYYRISSSGDYDDVYMVYAPKSDIVEDDHCTVYGVTAGIYEYETVMGASQKIPQINAKYVDR